MPLPLPALPSFPCQLPPPPPVDHTKTAQLSSAQLFPFNSSSLSLSLVSHLPPTSLLEPISPHLVPCGLLLLSGLSCLFGGRLLLPLLLLAESSGLGHLGGLLRALLLFTLASKQKRQ